MLALTAHTANAIICPGDCDGGGTVAVAELVSGVQQSLEGLAAASCAAFDRNADQQVTIDELIAAVRAALDGCPPPLVPFSAALRDGALVLTPSRALRGAAVYAVVLTSRIADAAGRPLQADAAFQTLRGVPDAHGGGPIARFDADPEASGNPYPEARLARDVGVHIPDRFALRELPTGAGLDTARAVLRATADAVGAAGDFSTTAPIWLPLSAPIDPATVTPDSVRFFERRDARLDLEPLLAQLARQGIARAEVALAISFPTEAIEDDLLAARTRLDERAATLRASLVDPDPNDDLPIGVFAGTAAGAYADFLAASPSVAAVVHGLLPAPDFRDAGGLFAGAALDGSAPTTDAQLDFVLTLPRTPPPHPVVILQHGFGGDNRFVLTLAEQLAAEGLAAIGIDAVSHGRRGSPLDLLASTPLQTRDIFRQTVVDQMALVRAIHAGLDTDADGSSELDGNDIRYLGVSLGGILGATFIAVEPAVRTAVLNVAGGRVAFLGDNPGTRPIYSMALAQRAGLAVDDPAFEIFRQRMLELGQQALDPADPLNFARRWRLEPFAGVAPRRVLMQEGIDDQLVSNASTEALAATAGLPADVAQSDANGVSGLWRFEPPGGHGILARADVRQQAVTFLASDGTVIAADEDCRATADCGGDGRFCLPPGEFPGCGICRQLTDCAVDADCAADPIGPICDAAPRRVCSCTTGARQCIPACSDDGDCSGGEHCAAGHCAAIACAADAACPARFFCNGGSCARRDCESDAACGAGACVDGRCYEAPGRCTLPPP